MATLRNHVEMIDLNPLVIHREACPPPDNATEEEMSSSWYRITDKIAYLPGGIASSSVHYHGCFHDLPNGLQTHVHAPMGLELRSTWTLNGNLPGEPREPLELGAEALGIPREGLYLREECIMKCNMMMVSFVKKAIKKSHGSLVEKLLAKAKLVDMDKSNASFVTSGYVPPHRQNSSDYQDSQSSGDGSWSGKQQGHHWSPAHPQAQPPYGQQPEGQVPQGYRPQPYQQGQQWQGGTGYAEPSSSDSKPSGPVELPS